MYGGAIAAILGEWQRAARLLEAGRAGMYAGAEGGIVYFHYRDVVRAALSDDEVRRCRDEGRALSLDDALVLALR